MNGFGFKVPLKFWLTSVVADGAGRLCILGESSIDGEGVLLFGLFVGVVSSDGCPESTSSVCVLLRTVDWRAERVAGFEELRAEDWTS